MRRGNSDKNYRKQWQTLKNDLRNTGQPSLINSKYTIAKTHRTESLFGNYTLGMEYRPSDFDAE